MNGATIKKQILNAIDSLFAKDADLLRMDVNERSISHKLAEHLAPFFPEYHIDCEYNRDGIEQDTKMLEYLLENTEEPARDPRLDTDAHIVYPDIIVHRRMTQENLAVIEVKKNTNREDRSKDRNKLQAFTRPNAFSDDGAVFHYRIGLALEFESVAGVSEDGELIARGIWFSEGEAESADLEELRRVSNRARR